MHCNRIVYWIAHFPIWLPSCCHDNRHFFHINKTFRVYTLKLWSIQAICQQTSTQSASKEHYPACLHLSLSRWRPGTRRVQHGCLSPRSQSVMECSYSRLFDAKYSVLFCSVLWWFEGACARSVKFLPVPFFGCTWSCVSFLSCLCVSCIGR